MIKIDGNTLTQIFNVVVYKDGIMRADLDEIQNFSLSNTEDASEIKGAGDVVLSRTKKNKGVEIKGTSGLLSGGLMELQTGGTEIYSATTTVNYSDTEKTVPNTVTDGVTTDYTAVGATNNEVGYIYVTAKADGTTTKYAQAASADATHFAYDTSTKKITLPTSTVVAGDTVICYYDIQTEGSTLTNSAVNYSTEAKVVVNCMAKDGCGIEARAQFIIPRCDFDGNFNIDLGGDQTVHEFSGKGLKNKCSTNNNLWDFKIFKLPVA